MSDESLQDLVVDVKTLGQVFNAPDVNPFSENRLEILGMSGLEYIVRQLQAHKRDWKYMRLLIRLPRDEIAPGLEFRLTQAIRRYSRAKIEDNRVEIHLIRYRSSRGLEILLAVVLALIAIAYLLFTGPLSGMPQVIQLAVGATISLFAWVTLWDPLEALVFNPVPIMRENFILRRLIELQIVVEPNTSSGKIGEIDESQPFGADAQAASEKST